MERMTRKDLNSLFALRARIERAEGALASLRASSALGAQVLTGMPHAPGVSDKTYDYVEEIAMMEDRIQRLRDQLSSKEEDVCEFLDTVDDECVGMALRLRYVHAMLWKEVAHALGQPKKRLTNQCYDYLKTLDREDESAPQDDGENWEDTAGHQRTREGIEGHGRTSSDTKGH